MDYVSFFDSIHLKEITKADRFKTPTELYTLAEIQKRYGEMTKVFLTSDEVNDLLKQAREYCSRNKLTHYLKYSDPEIENKLDETSQYLQTVASNCVGLINVKNARKYFLDTRFNKLVDLDEKVYSMIVGKDNLVWKFCIPEFNPFEGSVFTKISDGKEVHILNTFEPPRWIKYPKSGKDFKKSLIWKFLIHLFPEEEDREYALSWAHNCVFGRCQTYLCMIGTQGVGKGSFTNLLGQLVGLKYLRQIKPSTLDEKFNSELEFARLLDINEIAITGRERNDTLKLFSEGEITIEKKGEDPYTITNYSSGIISNNHVDLFKIDPKDRRYSAVELGSKNLNEFFTEEELEHLVKIKDVKFDREPHQDLIDFGYFLKENYPAPWYRTNVPYKENKFKNLLRSSVTAWQEFLISYIEEEFEFKSTEIKLVTLRKQCIEYCGRINGRDMIPSKVETINKFFDSYLIDGIKIGKAVGRTANNKGQTIQINPELKEHILKKREGILIETATEIDL